MWIALFGVAAAVLADAGADIFERRPDRYAQLYSPIKTARRSSGQCTVPCQKRSHKVRVNLLRQTLSKLHQVKAYDIALFRDGNEIIDENLMVYSCGGSCRAQLSMFRSWDRNYDSVCVASKTSDLTIRFSGQVAIIGICCSFL